MNFFPLILQENFQKKSFYKLKFLFYNKTTINLLRVFVSTTIFFSSCAGEDYPYFIPGHPSVEEMYELSSTFYYDGNYPGNSWHPAQLILGPYPAPVSITIVDTIRVDDSLWVEKNGQGSWVDPDIDLSSTVTDPGREIITLMKGEKAIFKVWNGYYGTECYATGRIRVKSL